MPNNHNNLISLAAANKTVLDGRRPRETVLARLGLLAGSRRQPWVNVGPPGLARRSAGVCNRARIG